MLHLLDPSDPEAPFPDVSLAEVEPNGLLAIGGDLSVTRLVNAYRDGIFPWFNAGDPVLWWSPDPRTVLIPSRLHVSRSLRKTIRKGKFETTVDEDFDGVIAACASPRADIQGTWLVPEMIGAYQRLHREGWAHSVEVWADGDLVGGLYGVAIGYAFFGESMFSRVSDASKVALVHLCSILEERNFGLVDCQVLTGHLLRMGAVQIPRSEFVQMLGQLCPLTAIPETWHEKRPHRRRDPDPGAEDDRLRE
jgi:leucyl/phenylalanyl-tRNA--protein transferase